MIEIDMPKRQTGRKIPLLRVLVAAALVVLILGVGVAGGVYLDRTVLATFIAPSNLPPAAEPNFKLMAEAWNTIHQNYVDPSAEDATQLTYGAISGMVAALGDTGHSRFLSPQMVQAENNFTKGTFDGIGAEVSEKDGQVVIVAPLDGSPAQKAGLHPGDVILKVDGTDVSGLPLEQVVSDILGPAGTHVTLTIFDPSSGRTADITLERAHIILHNVTWQILPGTTIAHVRVAAFSEGVGKELQAALVQMQQAGVTGIILDLRNDPGGLLGEAINVASAFISSGNVLLEKNIKGDLTPVPVVVNISRPLNVPMVVLVNQGTASAAEIVAGALQDAGRAKLVGETTFGTGTVLNQFGLSDGSALLLATQEWLTPAGRVIWHKGITPDVVVTLPADVVPLVPDAEQGMTSAQLRASGDQQLLRALDILMATTK